MIKRASILFQVNDEMLQEYVKQAQGDFAVTLTNNELTVFVKEFEEKQLSLEKVRNVAGAIARELKRREIEVAIVEPSALKNAFQTLDSDKVMIAFIEGWKLGSYSFDCYKTKKSKQETELTFTKNVEAALIQEATIRAEATAFARNLMTDIPSELNPETFPKRLKDTFAHTDVEVIVHNQTALEKMEMNGILAVNRGSKHEPAMIELHYQGDASKPLIAFVGKGVTFDTGGISLKNSRDLSDMRMDMGGAAAVAGAVKLLAEKKAKVNVIGLIQTVENIPDRYSLLPGDVITYKTGQTVQVGNTDAEGRLILADGLIRAGELEAEYIVDIATLTGAIVFALGPKMAGVFGDESLMQIMKEIGQENGDFVWPMPLIDEYEKTLKSDYADYKNISSQSSAGAITAALFLRKFVPEHAKWLHVDMAGPMEAKADGYYAPAGTGFGVRLLADYAVHLSNE